MTVLPFPSGLFSDVHGMHRSLSKNDGRVHGSIRSPITITRLRESPGQQLVFMAFDGYLYVIDGETACLEARDVGALLGRLFVLLFMGIV